MPQRRRRLEMIAAAALAALPAIRADAVDASQPAILQIFESSYRNLEKRTPDLFMAGYGAVWIPPTGRAEAGDLSVGYDPYDRFDLGAPGTPTLYGTENGLRNAVTELHKGAANVYADLVWNHNGLADKDTNGFVTSGGYPGFVMQTGGDSDGDFHAKNATGQFWARIPGISVIDIAQEKNHLYVRNPVPGFANNLPAGAASAYYGGARVANLPTEANRRFYPDLQGPSTTINGVTYYRWSATPANGDPVAENATGYLMRNTRWMVEEIGVDGFRLDASKHYVDPDNANPDWVLEYLDTAVNAGTKTEYLNYNPADQSTRKRVFTFGEYLDSNIGVVQTSIRKDANANRDALDFATHYALKNNLSGNGLQNDFRNLVDNIQDLGDGNHNGSQGVLFDRSHDDDGAYLGNVANAYLLMQPGNAVVYFNAKEFGTNRSFPKDGNGDALGGFYGDTLKTLVDIRNTHGRGNYRNRWVDKETFVMERSDALLAGYNNRLDAGYDSRTVDTDFAPGTRLVELTGNATSATIDPNGDIFDYVTVQPNGQVTVRVPRNKAPGTNGAQHNKGYVIYGPATPQGTLTLTNVDHTIAGETPTAANNGTARLTSFEVIKQNSFEVRLQTNHVLVGGVEDVEAGGDNAVLRFDGGTDVNGNGSVDSSDPGANLSTYYWPTVSSYGFDNFVTEKSPIYSGGSGLYRQTIDTTTLSEGYHYITARAYRHRPAAGTPLWTDFRRVIYVDRFAPVVNVDSIQAVSGQPTKRKIVFKSPDKTAQTVRFFPNIGANQYTTAQLLSLPASDPNAAEYYDRDLFRTTEFDWNNGNNAYTVVVFEPSYDPALGLAGGGVSIQRVVGQMVTDGTGAGLGDLNANGVIDSDDMTTFKDMLGGASNPINPNTSFHPGGDLNGDGYVDEADNILMVPWLTYVGASTVINDATNNRIARAKIQTSGVLDVPSGPLNVSGTTVQGVPLTVTASWGISANKTLTKTGGQSFTINGNQFHSANSTLLTTGGTTNINTNGGTNLAVNTSGAGSATNFGVTQTLRGVSVTSGGIATLTTASANNVNGGKVLNTKDITAVTGKLDLKNNNLAINYTGSSPLGGNTAGVYSGVLGMLQAGSNNGQWNGATGITSSSAAAMATQTALAAAEASQVLGLSGSATALWYGTTVDATTIVVKYTWGGDTNFDGLLNADDYFQIDSNYGKTPAGHFTGDFNCSGVVDGDDFFIIDANYSAQLGPIGSAPAGVQSVPEPAGATLLLSAAALLARRKRRTHSPSSR